MTTTPYMPMYWGDYLRDTGHLTTAQHGAYLLLLGHYWCIGSVPGDFDEQMAAITRQALADWQEMKPTIMALFKRGWTHKRIEEDLGKLYAKQNKRRVAGSLGGKQSAAVRSGRAVPKRFVGIDARSLSEAFASRLDNATSKIPPRRNSKNAQANASDDVKHLLRFAEANASTERDLNDLAEDAHEGQTQANASNGSKQTLQKNSKQLLPYQANKKERSRLEALEIEPSPVDNVDKSESGDSDEEAYRAMGIDPLLPNPLERGVVTSLLDRLTDWGVESVASKSKRKPNGG